MSQGATVSIADGTYKVVCAQDVSLALDVYNASPALRSNIWIYSLNDESNSQAFRLATESAGGQRMWVSTGADRCVDIQGYYTTGQPIRDGANVMIFSPDSYPDQRFRFEDSGRADTVINGRAYKTVTIVPVSNAGYAFDCEGGKAYIRDNLHVWTKYYGINQCFCLVPTTLRASNLAAPASVGGRLSESDAPSSATNLSTTSSKPTLYPTWKFPYKDAAIRTRWRGRKAGTSTWTAWTRYTALADGSDESWGWGTKGFRATSLANGWATYAGKGVAIDLATYDKVEVEIGVRPTNTQGTSDATKAGTVAAATSHGPDASSVVSVCRKPKVTVDSMGWSPAGLSLTMATTDAAGPVSGKVRVEGVTDWVAFSGEPSGAFTVEVAQDALLSVPTDGRSYAVSGQLASADKVAASWPTSKVVCSYNTGHGMSLSPSLAFSGDGHATTDLSAHDERAVWVEVDGQLHLMREDADGVTWLALPSERPYAIWAMARDGEDWGVWHKAYPATHYDGFRLTWEGGVDVVWLGDGANPKLSWSESANVSADLSTGRAYEMVTVGGGRKASATVSGGWMTSDEAEDARLSAILDARFAWLCSPRGPMWRVAIESGSCSQQELGWSDVEIGVRRVDG